MKKFNLLLVLLFLNYWLLAQSTGSLEGQVIDAETQQFLLSATVSIEGTNISTITDFDGQFILEKIPSGPQTVRISFIGYRPLDTLIAIQSDKTTSLGQVSIASTSVGIREIKVVASIAEKRKTPIAASTIDATVISDKLGNQEFPEIMRFLPSMYATKQGGGFGDARINVRGFNQQNTAVLVNGIPINDMENSLVYWSNWAGLSDIAQSIQLQRGLGASKLALPSVGGTINIITEVANEEVSGKVFAQTGNDGYVRVGGMVSSGRIGKGWYIMGGGSFTRGDGYIDATNFIGGSYYLSIIKKFKAKHTLTLTAFGAPQNHGQRLTASTLRTYTGDSSSYGYKYNADWGMKDGKAFNFRDNFYHKPVVSINHYWKIQRNMSLNTSAYYSIGLGGGTGERGSIGGASSSAYRDEKGLIRVDDIVRWNTGTDNIDGFPSTGKYNTPSNGYVAGERDGIIRRASHNDHQWGGLLSNFTMALNERLKMTLGIDIRYYVGSHYRKAENLLGTEKWLDPRDINSQSDSLDLDGDGTISSKEKGALKEVGDRIHYDNIASIGWEGAFAHLEYNTPFGLTVFGSGAFSLSNYQRTDKFLYLDSDSEQRSKFQHLIGYNAKLGANYNINKAHNIYFNTGYISKAPVFDAVFATFNNDPNLEAANEEIFAVELGYGLNLRKIEVNLNFYNTMWMNKAFFQSISSTNGQTIANIKGINATHRGIELDLTARPVSGLIIRAMGSYGDWRWQNNVNSLITDEAGTILDTIQVFAKNLKVGDAPQITFGGGVRYSFKFGLTLEADYWHGLEHYARFDPTSRTEESDRQPLKLPSYGLLDLGIAYRFKIKRYEFQIRANMNNVLGTNYIAEATDFYADNMSYEDMLKNARGFYGFGRTWNIGLRMDF